MLDKYIAEALLYVDGAIDVKKDNTIEGMVSVKRVVGNLGPVKTAVVRQRMISLKLFPVTGYIVDSVASLLVLQIGNRPLRPGAASRGGACN